WSAQLILREAQRFYSQFVKGRDLRLKRPPPFQEYVAWLERLNPSLGEAFWREYLRGFTAPTPLPTQWIQRGSNARDESNSEPRLRLWSFSTDALQALERKCHVTLNTLLQAAGALLLSRYSGEDVSYSARWWPVGPPVSRASKIWSGCSSTHCQCEPE